jgi:hypothetical protein
MTNTEELLSHAARCERLAQLCSDPAIAAKLRHLANDYRELAELPSAQSAAEDVECVEIGQGRGVKARDGTKAP